MSTAPTGNSTIAAMAKGRRCCSSMARLAQNDSDRCAARGLQPGTDAFSDCVARLETERKVRAESRYRDMVVERTAVPPYR